MHLVSSAAPVRAPYCLVIVSVEPLHQEPSGRIDVGALLLGIPYQNPVR